MATKIIIGVIYTSQVVQVFKQIFDYLISSKSKYFQLIIEKIFYLEKHYFFFGRKVGFMLEENTLIKCQFSEIKYNLKPAM